jgi:WD40 repeat protein
VLITLDDAGTIRRWDLSVAASPPLTLNPGITDVWAVAFFSDTLATTGLDGYVRIWDQARPGQPLRQWDNSDQLALFAVSSADGRYLVTAGTDGEDSSVRFWDWMASTSVSRTVVATGVQLLALAAASEGDQIVAAFSDGTITSYDASSAAALDTIHGPKKKITDVALVRSPNGAQVAATYDDGKLLLWDAANPDREPLELRGHEGFINQLAVGPHSFIATAGADGTARVWDRRSPAYEPRNLIALAGLIKDIALSPTGTTLVTVNETDTDIVAQFWDMADPESPRAMNDGVVDGITAVAYGDSDQQLFLGAQDGALSAWNLQAGAPNWITPRNDQRINAIAVDAQQGQVATASDDGAVRLWDLQTGAALATLSVTSTLPLVDVAFSPGGSLIAAAGIDGQVHFWQRANGQPLPSQPEPAGVGFSAIVFNSDGSELAAAREDGSIWRWKTADLTQLSAPTSGQPARALAFTQRHLITAHDDGAIQLWYLDDMTIQPVRLTGHRAGATDLIVQGENDLLSAAEDGTVRRWALTVEALADVACRGAGRSLRENELTHIPRQVTGRACGGRTSGKP